MCTPSFLLSQIRFRNPLTLSLQTFAIILVAFGMLLCLLGGFHYCVCSQFLFGYIFIEVYSKNMPINFHFSLGTSIFEFPSTFAHYILFTWAFISSFSDFIVLLFNIVLFTFLIVIKCFNSFYLHFNAFTLITFFK